MPRAANTTAKFSPEPLTLACLAIWAASWAWGRPEAEKIGSSVRVIVDRKEQDYYIGRSEFCSPEVDPEILIKSDENLKIGSFYNVRITDSSEFDLYGEVI